jgi:glycosyltransferase involved in cell wall biosynthesis
MVSIIIPYFNRSEKVKRCINSILNQSYQNFEILVIDDASKNPLILNIDDRIIIFRNNKNIGPGLSRNIGLDNAKGKYIAFIDSDDFWERDFLKETVSVLKKKSDLTFVYTQALIFKDGVFNSYIKGDKLESTILPNIFYGRRPWSSSSCLWSRKFIGESRFIASRNWEDYVFDVEVALKNNKIVKLPKNLSFIDGSGLDKVSIEKFRFQEKAFSILSVFKLLIETDYINNQKVKTYINKQSIFILEYFHTYNSNVKFTDRDILKILKYLNSKRNYLLIKVTYHYLPKLISIRVLNKIRKTLI